MKKTLGIQIPGYLIIHNMDEENNEQRAYRATLAEARKALKSDNCVYVFKVPKTMYHNFMFKYPLQDYYNCEEINKYIDDVNPALHVMKKQKKDFCEYIELIADETMEGAYNVIHNFVVN